MSSLSYLVKRILQMVPTVLIVLIAIFLLARLLPGDPAVAMLGSKATIAEIERMRHKLGLDQPIVVQFIQFAASSLSGDFGNSIMLKAPVVEVIAERIPATFFLTFYAIIFSLLLSVPLSFIAAIHRDRGLDIVLRAAFQIGLSMPVFYTGIVVLSILAARLRWFPVGGYGVSFADHMYHLLLPALTIAAYTSAILFRSLRASVIEVLDAEFVQFARSKGLSPKRVIASHVLRNALISTITLLGLSIGNLISGTLVTETVFGVPGVGSMMLEAIYARDYPVIQALTLTFAILVSFVFLATDMLQSWLDPRLRK